MRNIILTGSLCLGLILSPTKSSAATANVPFTGAVLSVCVLTVGTPGVIAPNSSYTQLSSKNAGGSAGTVTALATGTGFAITTEAPSSFTSAPAGGGTNAAFASSYSGSGATTISSTDGATQTSLNAGTTNLDVHLTATKSSGTFPAGSYSAEVLVRCE
jgi:hypothetical protein